MAMKKEALTNLIADDLAKRNENWTEIDNTFALKADKTYVDNQDLLKADKTYVDAQDLLKADKTYVDTKLSEKVQNFKLKNEIVNGDFSNGTTGWNKSSNVELDTTLVPHSLKFTSSTTSYVNQDISCALTDKVYIGGKLYISSASKSFDFFSIRNYGAFTNATNIYIDHTKINQWQKISTVISGKTEQGIRLYVGNSNTITVGVYYADEIMFINLTQVFGAGNEPTKEAMDKLVERVPNQWWDGELTLEQKEVVQRLFKLEAEKADKQQEAWITPTLQNGWVQTDSVSYPVGYYRDQFGIVRLKGRMQGGTNQLAFTLPAGYRPESFQLQFNCSVSNTDVACRVNVLRTGIVNIISTLPLGQGVYLEAVTFRTV